MPPIRMDLESLKGLGLGRRIQISTRNDCFLACNEKVIEFYICSARFLSF